MGSFTVRRLLVGCLFLTVWGSVHAAGDGRLVFERVGKVVATVRALDEKGAVVEEASALVVGSDRLVTRCEPIEGAAAVSIVWQGKEYAANIGQRDIDRNLCLLDARIGRVARLPNTLSRIPPVGVTVYAITHATGVGIALSSGVLAAVRKSGGEDLIQFSAPISTGATGGGLFDAQGNLIGIIDYAYRDGQNVNFAAPASWIGEIDRRAQSQRSVAQTREQVAKLGRIGDWKEVERLASEWTRVLPADRDAWCWLGLAQWSLGRRDEAERSLQQASTRGQLRDDIVANLAYVQAQQGKLDAAQATLLAATAQRKESYALWLALARIQHAAGKSADARASYQYVTELNPWSKEAQEGMAQLGAAAGDADAVMFAHHQLARIDPTAVWPWLVLADDYIRGKMLRKAAAAVARAESLSNDRSGEAIGDVLYFKGRIAVAEGRYADALVLYRKSLEHQPWSPAQVWSGIGDAYYEVLFYSKAVEAYREALRLQPSHVHARQWLIVSLKDDGRSMEALALLEEMKRSDPKDPFVWRQIGLAQQRLGRSEEAAAAIRESLKLDPRQDRMWFELIMEATRLGNREEALSAYQSLRGVDAGWLERARPVIKYWEVKQ